MNLLRYLEKRIQDASERTRRGARAKDVKAYLVETFMDSFMDFNNGFGNYRLCCFACSYSPSNDYWIIFGSHMFWCCNLYSR